LVEDNEKNEVEKKMKPIEIPEMGFAFKPKPGQNPVSKKEEAKEKKEPSLDDRVKWAMRNDTEETPDKKGDNAASRKKTASSEKSSAPEMPESLPPKVTDFPSQETGNVQASREEIAKIEEERLMEQKIERIPDNETVYADHIVPPKPSASKVFFPILVVTSILLLFLLIAGSIWTFSLKQHMVDLKSKALSNAEIAKKLVSEKSKIMEEYKPFKQKVEELTYQNASNDEVSARLEKQIEILTTELSSSKNKFPDFQVKLKEYADDVKTLVSGKVEYYKAYMQEKENVEQLELIISDMGTELDTLTEELASIDNKYRNKEAQYVYNTAFLNVKAKMYDEAIKNFKKFLELKGDDANVYYDLALLYEKVKHDTAKTIYYYGKYLEICPTASDLYEVATRISSLKRTGAKASTSIKNFKINLNDLKY